MGEVIAEFAQQTLDDFSLVSFIYAKLLCWEKKNLSVAYHIISQPALLDTATHLLMQTVLISISLSLLSLFLSPFVITVHPLLWL